MGGVVVAIISPTISSNSYEIKKNLKFDGRTDLN